MTKKSKIILISVIVAVVLIATSLILFFTLRKPDEATKTMNISLNPEVSFTLNDKDKIMSVSYKNEDAAKFYADVNFVGKDVDAALEIFVEKFAVSGHLDFNGENITISVSGKSDVDIDELKTKASNKVKEVFNKLGVTINVTSEKIQKATLVEAVSLIAPEMDKEELNKKSEEELIKILNAKQKEYEGLVLSQINEIKNNLTAGANKALLQAIKTTKDAFKKAQEVLDATQSNNPLYNTQKELLNAAEEAYNQAVEEFLSKKDELIKEAQKQYETLKTNLTNAFKEDCKNAKTAIESKVNTLDTSAKEYWNSLLSKYSA